MAMPKRPCKKPPAAKEEFAPAGDIPGTAGWPVGRIMRRGKNSGEDSLYAYGHVLSQQAKTYNEA